MPTFFSVIHHLAGILPDMCLLLENIPYNFVMADSSFRLHELIYNM